MKKQILTNLHDPERLEQLYRTNKQQFRQDFNQLYPEIRDHSLAAFWYERLNYETSGLNFPGRELLVILAAALVAGVIAKIPSIFGIPEGYFYPRHIGFVFLPLLTGYFIWKNKLQLKLTLVISVIMLISLVYINVIPGSDESDSFMLACIHLPLMLWVLLGVAFVGNDLKDQHKRLNFLSYNGDLLVMIALIAIAGGIMSGLTIGLFSAIGFNIEEVYFSNVVVVGMAAAPIIATYLIRTNPQLVGKVSPVIARLFTPLVLLMLLVYLGAMLFSGQDPYNDREFLLIFNLLLVGVMAIIFFSVAETSKSARTAAENWMLLLLSLVTIIVNAIALSAILFRISEWGITPNRIAVLGGNLLILGNLLLVTIQLCKLIFKKKTAGSVGIVIARYLPIYFVWTLVVVFLFPFIFGFE